MKFDLSPFLLLSEVFMGMLLRFYYFLFGYFRVSCEENQKSNVLNLLVQNEIAAVAEGSFSWRVSVFSISAFRSAAKEARLSLKYEDLEGFPARLWRHRKRLGLLVGAVFAAFLVFAAQNLVWRLEVIGNEKVSEESIKFHLEELGFREGTRKDKIDFLLLSDAYRLRYREISHMDIYCVGTVAYVHVIETDFGETDEANAYGNLVASKDAVIHSFDVLHGKVAVKEGAVVKKGDLLVSGVMEGAHESVLLAAEGKVYGTVTEDILVEIPYKHLSEEAREIKKIGFSINFFGKTINFQRNTGNLPTSYGTIVEKDIAILPSGKTLPFSLSWQYAVVCEESEVQLKETEALMLAFARLKVKIAQLTEEGYLLSKEMTAVALEDSCLVKCTVVYVTNIAEKKPLK